MTANNDNGGYFVSRNQNDLSPAEERRFDIAAATVLRVYGTWESISRDLQDSVGTRLHTVTVRRWLVERTLPCRMAFALVKLMDGKAAGRLVNVEDFHPWLGEYT